MTIKVIKMGQLPEEKQYRSQCYNCKSILEWQHKDAERKFPGDQRDGPFTQINCPVCGHTVTGY